MYCYSNKTVAVQLLDGSWQFCGRLCIGSGIYMEKGSPSHRPATPGISFPSRRSPSTRTPPSMTPLGKPKFVSWHILTKSAGSGAEIVKRKRLRRPSRRYLWIDYQSSGLEGRKGNAPKMRLKKSVKKVGPPERLRMQGLAAQSWRLRARRRQESALQGQVTGLSTQIQGVHRRTSQHMCHVHSQLVLQPCMWI
jgi:hypothetical protein